MLFKRIIQNQKKVESLCITCIMYSQFVIIDSPTICLFSRMSYMANYYIPPSTSQMEFLYRTSMPQKKFSNHIQLKPFYFQFLNAVSIIFISDRLLTFPPCSYLSKSKQKHDKTFTFPV